MQKNKLGKVVAMTQERELVPACSYKDGESILDGVVFDLATEEFLNEETGKVYEGSQVQPYINGERRTYSRELLKAATYKHMTRLMYREGMYRSQNNDDSLIVPETYDPNGPMIRITPEQKAEFKRMREDGRIITVKVGGSVKPKPFNWDEEPIQDDEWRESVRKGFRRSDLIRIYFNSTDPEEKARAAAELWPEGDE